MVVFSSRLDPSYHEYLQKLLFFNPNQAQVAPEILRAIERYGEPKIAVIDDRLRVALGSSTEVQTLFVLEADQPGARLVGVVVYTREEDTLVVVYVALDEAYAARGMNAQRLLFLRIVDELRSVARRIKGVGSLTLFCGGGTARRIRVR